MRRIKLLHSGDISEETIHKTVMKWVRSHHGLDKFVLHFPNEGKRTCRFGKLLKDMGMRAGVSDLFIAIPRHGFCGAWIELKSKNGRVNSSQKDFLSDMESQGYFTKVCRSIEDSIEIINWYCFK